MKALNDYVIVIPSEEKTITETGTPGFVFEYGDKEKSEERYRTGVIDSIGNGVSEDFLRSVDVGFEVVFEKHAGHEYRKDGKIYRVMRARDIAIVL